MTHDELVQFAAEKAGWVLRGSNDHTKPLHKRSKDFPGTWIEDWENKGPHPRWEGPNGELVYLCGCDKSTHGMPDLTSPDLFFKGLDACPHFVVIRKDEPVYGYNIVIIPEYGALYKQSYTNINEIPQKFWECWAEVEGKGDLTKED